MTLRHWLDLKGARCRDEGAPTFDAISLRIGEFIGLRWEDVYLDSNVLVVRQTSPRACSRPPSRASLE